MNVITVLAEVKFTLMNRIMLTIAITVKQAPISNIIDPTPGFEPITVRPLIQPLHIEQHMYHNNLFNDYSILSALLNEFQIITN